MRSCAVKFLSLLVLAGCGRPTLHVDPVLQPYVARFHDISIQVGRPTDVIDLLADFGDTSRWGDAEGRCQNPPFHTPHIIISAAGWPNWNEAHREVVMLHELGHCVLGRGHDSSTHLEPEERQVPVPDSLMYPRPNDALYLRNPGLYQRELFHAN